MNGDAKQFTSADDPASAFADLRGEVSLLRRAIEGLTAERQSVPDYTPTLKALSARLARAEELLGNISESPAMELTPENFAMRIARASETAREGDREIIRRAHDTFRVSVSSINGVVKQAFTANRQRKQLYWAVGGGLALGAIGALSLVHFIG